MLRKGMDAYAALAQRIADAVREVQGCLILSRDGFVLGTYPDEDEGLAKSAWLRFASLGESERGVVEFAGQTWAFVRRGPYSSFAVAAAGVRPGILIDRIEEVLIEAERARSGPLRIPEQIPAPSGKPHVPLHPPGEITQRRDVPTASDPPAEPVPRASDPPAEPVAEAEEPPPAEPSPAERQAPVPPMAERDEGEVDRFLLAKEFSGLLQIDRSDDEAPR
jgi:hypothetical protein